MRMISITAFDAALLTQAARGVEAPEPRLLNAILNAETAIANGDEWNDRAVETGSVVQLHPALPRLA